MKGKIALAVLALFFSFQVTAEEELPYDKENPPLLYGVGSKSCGSYLDAMGAPALLAVYDGFLSGYATYHGARMGTNVFKGTDTAGTQHWLKNYCTSNPTEPYAMAVAALVAYMTEKHNKQ